MTYQPETEESIQDSIERQISNQAPDITAWFERTSNTSISSALSDGLYNRQQELLYVWFASTLRYAGKQITADDCRRVGADPAAVNLPLINALQSDADLDSAAADRGVVRNPGAFARGEIVMTFADSGSSAPAGVEVTAPTVEGVGKLSYVTTEPADTGPNGVTDSVPVRGVERGERYNTGSERIGQVPNQPSNADTIQSVSNPDSITGGEPPESNSALRERARGASLEDANLKQRLIAALNDVDGGGGVIEDDIDIQEFEDPSEAGSQYGYPYFDVILDYNGPTDTLTDSDGEPVADLQGLIDSERAYGIAGYYVAPEVHMLDVSIEVAPAEPSQTNATKNDIDEAQATNAVVDYLSNLGLGDDLYAAQLTRRVLNSDDDAAYLPSVSLSLTAPDGTTTSVGQGTRAAIAPREKVTAGTVSITAVSN